MKIQILGTGCPKCRKLTENAEAAAKALQLDYELEKISDIKQIISFGVMTTPALVLDGKIVLLGAAPSVGELKTVLSAHDSGRQ